MKPSCAPFSGETSGRIAVTIPTPTNDTDATASSTSAARKSASREGEAEEQRHDREQRRGAHEPVEDAERPHPEQVHRPRQRGHERVLDGPLPALPRDGLGEDLEDDPQVGPDHRADEQARRLALDVELAAGRLDALGDEDDRQRVGDGPREERELPEAVALDQVGVALDHAQERDGLAAPRGGWWCSSRRLLVVVVLAVLERAAGGGQERVLERRRAVAAPQPGGACRAPAAARRRGSRRGRPAPRPRPCRACTAAWWCRACGASRR